MQKVTLVNFTILLAFAALLISSIAEASIVPYTHRTTFNSQCTISENYGYDDFGTDFSYPSNPWASHGVTYTTTENIIIGTGTSFAPISNVFCNDYWSPITATIDNSPMYNMFGLDLGYLGTSSGITFDIITNIRDYSFYVINAPIASQSLVFYGFILGSGEYFTGFSLTSDLGNGSAPAIDNVTLGSTSSVPEPATMLLLGLGLVGLAGARRKFKK